MMRRDQVWAITLMHKSGLRISTFTHGTWRDAQNGWEFYKQHGGWWMLRGPHLIWEGPLKPAFQ